MAKKRTPRQQVLLRHPAAFCQYRSLYGEWHVYMKPEGRLIGIGYSAKSAWSSAAELLRMI